MNKVTIRPIRRARIQPVQPRRSDELAYQREINKILRKQARFVRESIIPVAVAMRDQLTRDDAVDDMRAVFTEFTRFSLGLQQTVTAMVYRVFTAARGRHTQQWTRRVRAALSIDLEQVIRDEELESLLRAAVDRNVALIKGLTDDVERRVRETVYRNASQGNSVKTLRQELTTGFQISQRRAKTIARDQTAKFNAEMTKARQTQIGVTKYEWVTSADERVRPTHRNFNGQTFTWKTGSPEGHPGEPINCRCVAVGIVEP